VPRGFGCNRLPTANRGCTPRAGDDRPSLLPSFSHATTSPPGHHRRAPSTPPRRPRVGGVARRRAAPLDARTGARSEGRPARGRRGVSSACRGGARRAAAAVGRVSLDPVGAGRRGRATGGDPALAGGGDRGRHPPWRARDGARRRVRRGDPHALAHRRGDCRHRRPGVRAGPRAARRLRRSGDRDPRRGSSRVRGRRARRAAARTHARAPPRRDGTHRSARVATRRPPRDPARDDRHAAGPPEPRLAAAAHARDLRRDRGRAIRDARAHVRRRSRGRAQPAGARRGAGRSLGHPARRADVHHRGRARTDRPASVARPLGHPRADALGHVHARDRTRRRAGAAGAGARPRRAPPARRPASPCAASRRRVGARRCCTTSRSRSRPAR